jgi:glyoxylase-like metal-dependent hydrolase (beta-lactamase superfamily II)
MQVTPAISTHAIEWAYGDYVEPLSVHIVETDEATVMVGGGDEPIADEVIEIARSHDIDVVLVEHAHIDHYGAVPAIREAMDVTVAIPEKDADALRSAGIEPDVTLTDGQLQWGIEPIATPGHTPGNMAYRTGDVLLAGDTVVGSDSVFAAADEWSGPLAVIEARFNTDDTEARRSVSRLREVDIETLLVSHGSHVRNGVDRAIETLCRDLA